ncbi:hypothetical protein HHK36_010126 [Tetracentron sinense]|uniref:5'-nucleotidase domain-containing protein 4 n=1 Tax=Tetracentron sinense TaxID=13715 RepID=A0A834ZGC5_TETSI|nr:hypothetical protein HHK36_010126 [Tetracentron sinense]
MSPPTTSSTSSCTTTLRRGTDSLYPPLALTLPRCLNSKMRIPKTPFFSPDLSHLFSSRIRSSCGFLSAQLSSVADDQSPRRRKGIDIGGTCQLHASYIMDGAGVDDKTSQFHNLRNNDSDRDRFIWSSREGGCKISTGKQIFCNRSLNMKNIVAVGFDMDYTLAQYMPETFESLAYNGTIQKLVSYLEYPQELLEWSFDWKYMVRGLVLDKKRGNILKMDRHKYVKVAYHGFSEMSKEDKIATYGNTLIRDSFDEPDYALIDTLFSLAEAYLFAQLVDFKDNNPGKIPDGTDYSRMYKDVRAAVDLCHRDGTLKQMVAKDPKRYINEDPSIVPMLKMLRDSGRATFLVTNSLWDYTNIVMNFLCGHGTQDGSSCNYDWLENFDVVITGSYVASALSVLMDTVSSIGETSTVEYKTVAHMRAILGLLITKPSFFHEDNRANIFEVEPESGMLLNTDNGIPTPQIGNISPRSPSKRLKKGCRVFQGGSVGHLHKLLSIEASSQVLYVGDHIYGDILRSKKILGWRTMLVVPELEREVELLSESKDSHKKLQFLRKERDLVEDKMHRLKWFLKFEDVNVDEKQKLSSELEKLEWYFNFRHGKTSLLEYWLHLKLLHRLRSKWGPHEIPPPNPIMMDWNVYFDLGFEGPAAGLALGPIGCSLYLHHIFFHELLQFHKVWGQLMKTGYQNSRFAHQVERFACLYTSQVTNLGLYSPDKYYRPSEDFMPHEFDVLSV